MSIYNQTLFELVEVVRVANATAAGTSDINGSVIDMSGYDAVSFLAGVGALTATQVTLLKAQHGDAANLSDAADITGATTTALADGDGDKTLLLEVLQPRKRYVRAVLDRGTANAVLDGMWAFLYRARKEPVTQGSTVVKHTKVVPTA